ncbi:MAG: hypothetical protein WC728_01105 [Elusimicrobiota bacterium]
MIPALMLSMALAAQTFEPPQGSPLAAMKWLYETRDADALLREFKRSQAFAASHPELFMETLEDIHGHNDRVDFRAFPKSSPLPLKDGMRLSIRIMARAIFRMRDIPGSCAKIEEMLALTRGLPQDWRVTDYFTREAYYAMAAACPAALLRGVKERKVERRELALIALLRSGHPVSQELAVEVLKSSYFREALPILYYLDDPGFKGKYLDEQFETARKTDYYMRMWAARDLINAYASFPAGVRRLEELRDSGQVKGVRVAGIWFGTLGDSGLDPRELEAQTAALTLSAEYINRANAAFGGKEPVLYVDFTPDVVDGHELNPVGWSGNALYSTIGELKRSSAREAAFTLAHEACEQRFYKGRFSAAFGRTYWDAFDAGGRLLEVFRIGNRIGEKFEEYRGGHPWDSEREWLAEVASAALIGEPLPEEAAPALEAVRKLFVK